MSLKYNIFIYILGQRKNINSSAASSSGSSSVSIKHLYHVIEHLKSNQNRKSTTKNYLSIWRNFNGFLINLEGDKSGLSWEEKTVLFGTHLVEKGAQSATIASYFSAIKHILKTDDYPWDEKKAQLIMITRSCRILNDTLRIRLPIQIKLLELILFELDRHYGGKQPYLCTLYKAAFSLAYYGLMRVGELTEGPHNAKAKDVHIGMNKDKILIVLYSSKTHGLESRPQKIKISAATNKSMKTREKFFCPFKLMRHYIAVRGSTYESDAEPLLVFSDKSPLKAVQFRKTLRMMLEKLNLNPSLYNTHSLRAGRSNDLKIFGYSIPEIRKAGRWRSKGVIFKYLSN